MLAVRARIPVYPLPANAISPACRPSPKAVCGNRNGLQWGADITPQRIDEIARQHQSHDSRDTALRADRCDDGPLSASTETARRAMSCARMEAERIVSQPNYVYVIGQGSCRPRPRSRGTRNTSDKLRLAEVQQDRDWQGVTVAVIDSEIDQQHSELRRALPERFDAVGKPDRPHLHGTGMAGAIVSQGRLLGVAPGARTLAVMPSAPAARQQSPQATTQSTSPASIGRCRKRTASST